MDALSLFPIERFGMLAAYHAIPKKRQHELPLLFVHGAWGGKYEFEQWLHFAQARGWEGYALDLRGHHDSSMPGTDIATISIEDFVADVEQAIDRIGSCYLIGHSQGGLIAQAVAARNIQVKKAVFVSSSPPSGIRVINTFALRMLRYMPGLFRHMPFMLSKDDAARFLFNDRMPEGFALLTPDSSTAALQIAFGKIHVGAIPCPTLVVAGALDRSVPPSVERQIAQKYGSAFIEIPGRGHMLMLLPEWETPIEKILSWLAG